MSIDELTIIYQIKLILHYDYDYTSEQIEELINLTEHKINSYVIELEENFLKFIQLLVIIHRKNLLDYDNEEEEDDLLDI